MSEGTICPKMLCFWEQDTPENFEANYISPVLHHLQECKRLDVKTVISAAVLGNIREMCPWSLCAEDDWKKWIIDWNAAVLSKLEKFSVKHDPELVQGIQADCPLYAHQDLWIRWCGFLQWWQTGEQFNQRWLKGIAANNCPPQCQLIDVCGRFHRVPPINWRLIKHPWLLRYDENLPEKGPFPFVPPINWQAAQLHGHQHGFLDINGNEWCWDMLHDNHWDVQLTAGGYRNVSPDGQIL